MPSTYARQRSSQSVKPNTGDPEEDMACARKSQRLSYQVRLRHRFPGPTQAPQRGLPGRPPNIPHHPALLRDGPATAPVAVLGASEGSLRTWQGLHGSLHIGRNAGRPTPRGTCNSMKRLLPPGYTAPPPLLTGDSHGSAGRNDAERLLCKATRRTAELDVTDPLLRPLTIPGSTFRGP